MSARRSILFIDGENLVFRYQAMLATGKTPSPNVRHIPDVFVWHPALTEQWYLDVLRVYFYRSVIGDDTKLAAMKAAISQTKFTYQLDEEGLTGSAQIVPVVLKKEAKTHKSRQVDIQIAIDMMRFAQNPTVEILCLVSGDGDFLPLINETMRLGNEVYVCALSSGLSPALRYSVDEFSALDEIFFPVNQPKKV